MNDTPNDKRPDFIRIEGVSKSFGDFIAVDDVTLDIARGELFSILGGSGCGKTTLLRILAGFETPDCGRVVIDGVDVTSLPAHERPVNMMFQSYAVFPHMNVRDNVAYGLRKDGVGKQELKRRVDEALALVQLDDFAGRRPEQLSGGQRQRVALARAIVKRPKVLLLDEPLAALDKKLREHTQFELMSIQFETGITFVVVTHDQEEAMTLSTRIAVMDKGRLLQVDEPKQVYEYPCNRFVADFIGTINTFSATVTAVGDDGFEARLDDLALELQVPGEHDVAEGQPVWLALRPEKIFLDRDRPADGLPCLSGVVDDYGYFGNLSLYRVKLPGGQILQVSRQNRQRSARRFVEWEDTVWVSWQPTSTVVLTG